MVDPLHAPQPQLPTGSSWEFISTSFAILVALGGFFLLDVALVRVDRRESASQAASLYAEGKADLARGDPRDAAEKFADAYAMQRENRDYELALAEALLADGRVDEAHTTLSSLLARAETDGAVNIAMARVLVREGRIDDAKAYYHRAIYGRWRTDTTEHRLQSRIELVHLLTREGDEPELLAELLSLEDIASESVTLRRQVAHLFITAGSPARGIAIFRELLRRDGNDADSYEGLGEGALALGNFHTAQADLREAHRLDPSRTTTARLLAIADTVIALNPEERGLGTHERVARARELLARTIAIVERCSSGANGPAGGGVADSARAILTRAIPRREEAASLGRILETAAALWDALPDRCQADPAPAGKAVALLQSRIAQ